MLEQTRFNPYMLLTELENRFLAITFNLLNTDIVSYNVVNQWYMLLLKPSVCIILTYFLNNHF